MTLSITPLSRDDGAHAFVEGFGDAFRFRVGFGQINVIRQPSAHIWSVDGPAGFYLIQFLTHIPRMTKPEMPLDILQSHFALETDFQLKTIGQTVADPGPRVLIHPCKSPMLVWLSRNREDAPVHTNPEGRATPYGAHATLVHESAGILHFSITGLGPSWNEEDLYTQALRAGFSYFPLSNLAILNIHNRRPHREG
jgi:hypothetical protein